MQFETLAQELLKTAQEMLKEDWMTIAPALLTVMMQEQENLKEIYNAYSTGAITKDELQEQLEDEKQVILTALLAVQVENKKRVEDAVNALTKKIFQVLV